MAREYKDSGIEWIGQIPKEWEVIRLKFLCTIQTGNKDTQDATPDGVYPFYVRSPKVEKSETYSFDGEGILMAGDGVGAGRVFHHVFGKYAVHQRVYRLANITGINSSFLFYYISNLFGKEMDRGSAQSTVPSVRLPMLQNFIISTPLLSEQQKIACYLDKVCGEVDEMVALQETMIEELKAYKQSVITEAVTKGLNPNVPMRDSGIDWIGDVPEHWEIRRLKYIGISENGLTYSPKDMCDSSDGGILVLRSSNIKDGKLVFDDNVYVYSAPQILHVNKGDIIICSRNGSAALVGKSAIVEEDMYATFGAFMMRFRSSHNTRYINYLLTAAVTQYKQLFSTTTINQLTKGVFGNLEMPFINSQDEQQSIASYLDSKCAEIDALIAIKQVKIEELKEYKQSVIYEYVTGKKVIE